MRLHGDRAHQPDSSAMCGDLAAKQVLTPAQAAHLIGLSKTTVIAWSRRGILPGLMVGSRLYLRRSALIEGGWLPKNENAAEGKSAAKEGA
jgi:excisionase family DNA binding protein